MASLLLQVRLRRLLLLALALVLRRLRLQEEALRLKVLARRLRAIVQRTEMLSLLVLQLLEWVLWLFYCK